MTAAAQDRCAVEETLDWRGITLRVRYEPECFGKGTDHPIAHLDIRVLAPQNAALPITTTGYRSHFLDRAEIEAAGSLTAYLHSWLDAEASRQNWHHTRREAEQLLLF